MSGWERLNAALNFDGVAERVGASGMSGPSALATSLSLTRCALTLAEAGTPPDHPACAFVVPGRIEVLGKHTDYGGGRSLLAAAERGFRVVARPRSDAQVTLLDVRRNERIAFQLSPTLEPASGWANYPMTVGRRISRNFEGPLRGADIVLASDLPDAAGMSSSSAFIVATFLVLCTINRLDETQVYRDNIRTEEDLAVYLATIENGQSFRALQGDRGVGTQGGSEDHTAILCACPGGLVQYAFAPGCFEREIGMPAGHAFVIGASGVRAEKTGAARERYNRAARQMRAVTELWREASGLRDGTLGELLRGNPGCEARIREAVRTTRHAEFEPEVLLRRLEHFILESQEIIPAAGDALARGDLTEFGSLVDRSQHYAETLLGNQVPETVALARSARELGAAAASAFGAGFGGSVWALVPIASAAGFMEEWRARYRERFPDRGHASEFFITQAGPAAVRIA